MPEPGEHRIWPSLGDAVDSLRGGEGQDYELVPIEQRLPAAELRKWALRQYENAYTARNRRAKCSRVDFYAGYRAALIDLHAWSQFRTVPAEASD